MSDETIRCLGIMEHIRLRPGMYIANTGNGEQMEDGIYSLFQEVFENAVDELSSGYGGRIHVTLKNRTLRIRDFGRGIPPEALPTVLTVPFSSGKIRQDIYRRPIGMHGLGLKVVAALSDFLNVRTIRSGKYREIRISRGAVLSDKSGECRELNGCEISFSPDPVIFSDFHLQPAVLEKLIRLYCCANPFLTVEFNEKEFHHFHGLMDSLVSLIGFETMVADPIRLCCEDMECVLVQCDQRRAQWCSFVNGHRTVNGGIHVNAVRSALWGAAKVIMKGSSRMRPDDIFTSVTGIVSVRIDGPMFEAQTKNRLGNVDRFAVWQRSIQEALLNYWYGNVDLCEEFFTQVDRNMDRREKEASAVEMIHDTRKKEAESE